MPLVDRPAFLIEGQADLLRALVNADRESRLFVRREFRAIAKPVADDAEQLALNRIRNMPKSPKWAKQRIGVTRNLVYVAPRQKGTHGRGPGRRPNLGDLIISRSYEPAFHMNEAKIERRVEHAFDDITDHFNRGGPL